MKHKIAFLFLLTKDPNKIELWEKYFENIDNELYNVYIHNDKNNLKKNFLNSKKKIVQSSPTSWGCIIDAYFQLFRAALHDDRDNKFFVIISESCIPIKSFHNLYNYLIRYNKSLIEVWEKKKYDTDVRLKTNNNHIKHSAFWILKRNIIEILMKNEHRLKKIYNRFLVGEEFFLNDVYVNNKNQFVNRVVTYTDWQKDKIKKMWYKHKYLVKIGKVHEANILKKEILIISAHPKTFDHIPKDIILKDAFFARKFI